ncbi:DUF523 and DUF1722 domain-containing protein [Aurantivibrio infirmus]
MNETDSELNMKPLIAVGSCLVGQPVRFNGGHKRHNPHIEKLQQHADLVPLCPEVGIGMGVPREAIRLVEIENKIYIRDSETQTIDYTEQLKNYAREKINEHPNLSGYILVKGSPSCGLERVPRYNAQGNTIASDRSGVYAQEIIDRNPLLPTEEDGRLYDHGLRESFISRVFLYHDWQQLNESAITLDKVTAFYSRYKYTVMAHSVPIYKQLGPMLANAHADPIKEVAEKTISLMMAALKKVATTRSHTNVLQHIQGYLKRSLSKQEKQSLKTLIEQYHKGIVPLITPITLLKHHFEQKPDPYIENQTYMQPYPDELALRSHLY